MKLIEKEKAAIKFLRNIPQENIAGAFSGGKDSIVLYYLIKQSGINCPINYGNTTIDPAGTISLIKTYYPDVNILHPEKSFYKLIEDRGLPTRVGRFCCQELKEKYGIGKNNIDGIRWEESTKRGKYEPEQCDTRVFMKGAKHYYPIINYTEKDVWQTIKENNLQTTEYYHAPYNWKRHGCVGCPLAGAKQQVVEYKTFPRYAKAVILAIEKNIKRNGSLEKISNNPYEVFWWWISEKSIKEWKSNIMVEIFKLDYKLQFEKIILGL